MKTTTNSNKYFLQSRHLHRLIAVNLIVSLLFFGTFGINRTSSYYNDVESSGNNSFSSGMLDFILTNNTLEKVIGPEVLGEVSHASVAMPIDGSLPMQYDVITSVDTETSDMDFCNGLALEAKLNGISKYNGPLPGFANAVTTEFGSWEFRLDLPPNVSIPNNVNCNADILFSAWRADISNKADSGWHDEETLNISLTSRMVVLNEIYAKPNGGIAPLDREYIELYNNSSAPVDVLGWKISEIAGSTEVIYPIVATGAVAGEVMPYDGASIIIPVGGSLVLEFGGVASHLNDTGDTVRFYDNNDVLLDSLAYGSVVAGKAIVRYPGGIGFWVDPEPTPGTENMVSLEDLLDAGFSQEMIDEVIKLMAIKNVSFVDDTIEVQADVSPDATPVENNNQPSTSVVIIEESGNIEQGENSSITTQEEEPTTTETPTETDTEIKPEEQITTEESVTEETPTEEIISEEETTPVDNPTEESAPVVEDTTEETVEDQTQPETSDNTEEIVEEQTEEVTTEEEPAVVEQPIEEVISNEEPAQAPEEPVENNVTGE